MRLDALLQGYNCCICKHLLHRARAPLEGMIAVTSHQLDPLWESWHELCPALQQLLHCLSWCLLGVVHHPVREEALHVVPADC